ncbi:MAG: hypothetical protein V1861_01995 [Candidatus Micrarchaeota archaeon]
MKWMACFLLVLTGLAFAVNDALPAILDARYDYASCDVEYAKDWLSMREDCADTTNVPVFDSSSYVDDLDDDMADMREAVDENRRYEFGLAAVQLGADSLKLIGEVVKDAFQNKTSAFFSCVRDGEIPLMEVRDECRLDALDKEKSAAKSYVENEIDEANLEIANLDELGADTSGMEGVVEKGEELLDDIYPAYESGNITKIVSLHLRNSRLVLLFRAEQMLAVLDYAEPIIEAGNNDNKDEILSRGRALRDEVKSLISQCEYSATVDNNFDYGRENLECWDDGIDLLQEFNAIRVLILEGA